MRCVCLLALIPLLGSCGFKGDLYIPEDSEEQIAYECPVGWPASETSESPSALFS
ncbi:MAG: LPS translocon maturation chaperone LptM [Candidatus Eutrophobiaceae bacterium]